VPALLVYDAGGNASPKGTGFQKFVEVMKFRIIAVAGSFRGRMERLKGSDAQPGCEELCNWGVYYSLRAVAALSGIKGTRPTMRTQSVVTEARKYVASWDIECKRYFDIWDGELPNTLTVMGLVANPVDPASLWLDPANTQPNIADPATKQGGRVEL